MSETHTFPVIAIIGCGPRGLSALESLFVQAAKSGVLVKALVIEKSEYPGAGQVYDLDQPDSNWMNVSERTLAVPPRKEAVFADFSIPEFPDFQHWSGYSSRNEPKDAVDRFPLRSKVGTYLHERFMSVSEVLTKQNLLTFVRGEVDNVDIVDNTVKIDLVGGSRHHAKEAVLCIGHQPIEFDEQMSRWQNSISEFDGCDLFTQPYPLRNILESSNVKAGETVALRGFGLAMIDVARGLTEGLGGTFDLVDKRTRAVRYRPSGKEPKAIVPFSLDGLPMAPKPLNRAIDDLYVPSNAEIDSYKQAVVRSIESKEELKTPDFLIGAIAPIIASKFIALGSDTMGHRLSQQAIQTLVENWLGDGSFSHDLILSKDLAAAVAMENFIGMATGTKKVSLDFCIGHVWRHCQPTMYKLLSFAPFSDELIADIVALDERLKRYSYGPPVDSLQQLLALEDAEIIDLNLVSDPKIELTEEGWKLQKNGRTVTAKTIINTVLDAPQILKVASPLAKRLIKSPVMEPVHDELGVRTQDDAILQSDTSKQHIPLGLLGRLAKGTLIGVDAIAECFGSRSGHWAENVIRRIMEKST